MNGTANLVTIGQLFLEDTTDRDNAAKFDINPDRSLTAMENAVRDPNRIHSKNNSGNGTAWLELLKSDSEAAFVELVNRYQQEIYDLCVRISGSRTEAEDLTQETFIRAYENLKTFRGDAQPRTWLYRIAINLSISFTRRLKRWRMQRSNDEGELPQLPELTEVSPEQEVEWKDLAEHAHKAIGQLPARQRAAVVLRVIREMTYEEVAEAMGISIGGVKANVHQGLKKLKVLLEE